MAKIIQLWYMLVVTKTVSGQEFIFKSLDNHEDRIAALETMARTSCMGCCECNDIKTKYESLKIEMGQISNMVNDLTSEIKRLREIKSSTLQNSFSSLYLSTTTTPGYTTQTVSEHLNSAAYVITPLSTLGVTLRETKSGTNTNTSETPSIVTSLTRAIPTNGVTSQPSTTATTLITSTVTSPPSPITSSTPSYTTAGNVDNISTPSYTTAGLQHDCKDVLRNGHRQNGLYNLTLQDGRLIEAFCDLETDGGGWIVIQRRIDGTQDFNQNWNQYKHGFGKPSGEFWIGNENIHVLTSRRDVALHVKLMTWNSVNHTAVYGGFRVGAEQDKYKLTVGQFISGDAGDSFNYPSSYMLRHNNMAFSTPDSDNSYQNCAQLLQSGWWFNLCYSSNLNGRYLKSGPYGNRLYGESFGQPTMEGTGIEWYPLTHKQYSMKFVEMKIKAT